VNILEYDKLCRIAGSLARIEKRHSSSETMIPLQIYNDVVDRHNEVARELLERRAQVKDLKAENERLRACIAERNEAYAEMAENKDEWRDWGISQEAGRLKLLERNKQLDDEVTQLRAKLSMRELTGA